VRLPRPGTIGRYSSAAVFLRFGSWCAALKVAARLECPRQPSPKMLRRRYLSPDGRYAAVAWPGAAYIVLVEKSWPTRVSISSLWESEADYSPNCHASTPISSRPGRYCAGDSQLGPRGRFPGSHLTPIISSRPGSCIVFYAKFPTLTLSSRPGKDTVLVRKRCRPAQERTSSCPATHIVLSGNLYRVTGEKLSSHLGNVCSFSLQTCPFFSARGSGTL
jgi:hypothetical protein